MSEDISNDCFRTARISLFFYWTFGGQVPSCQVVEERLTDEGLDVSLAAGRGRFSASEKLTFHITVHGGWGWFWAL